MIFQTPSTRVVAVTGTSGRAGAAIAAALETDGWFVRGIDRAPGRQTSILGDLREPEVRRAALQQSDLPVHAAACTHALIPDDQAVWVDETLEPRPRDLYDETKLAAEQLVAAAATPSVTLRIARCFPEPLPVLATHLLHRAVALDVVATAVVRVAKQHAARDAFGYSPMHGIHQLLGLR